MKWPAVINFFMAIYTAEFYTQNLLKNDVFSYENTDLLLNVDF